MLGVCDACFHWLPWLKDCQSLLFGALPLSLSLSCRSLASWIFGITIPFINLCSLELCLSASLWVAVHWHHGLWHHSSFHKLCSLKLCYSASLRVVVYWLTSLYLHLSMDFTFTMTIGLCSFTESFRPCHSPPWLSWLLTWLRSIIWRRFLSMSMKVPKLDYRNWFQYLYLLPWLTLISSGLMDQDLKRTGQWRMSLLQQLRLCWFDAVASLPFSSWIPWGFHGTLPLSLCPLLIH